jgi:uncharacterized damage-inducible protein DinB
MTPEQSKLLCKVFVDTMQTEAELTKKVMRAIPEDKKAYKPEEKSKNAHELAWHIATSEIWFIDGVLAGKFSFDGAEPATPPTIGGIIEWYESNHRDRVARLNNLSAEALSTPITMIPGMEWPAVAYLNFMNLHTAHHRGQLSTYLRPMGSKVPSIYGGSADEPFQMPAEA